MNKTTKAISIVTVLLLISRPLGFIREMVIAAFYGATYQTDAYNMAIGIISLSTAIISAGVSTVIIPMYNHKRIQQSKEAADLFANNILWISSLFCAVLSIIGIVFAPVLVRVFAPNFSPEAANLTITIVRFVFIFSVASNIINYMISISRIYDKFAVTIISSYPFSIITVVFIIFFSETLGIYALVISYILFLLIQVSILVLSARKIFNFKAILNFTNGDLRSVVKLSLPIYLSIAVWEIDAIVNRMLASGLPEGSITAMAYADRLRYLPDGIITASVLAVIYPLLSKYAAQKDIFNLKAITVKSLSLLTMALLPIIAVSIYYATEITKIVYERGAFTSDNTILTANVFIFIIMSLFFSGGAALLSNSFYGSQDTKTPQIAAVIMVTFKITLSVILVPHMQAAGLALATSIAFLVFFITLSIQFRVKFGAFGGRALFKNSVKCIFASICMIPVFILCEFFRDKLPLFFFFAAAAAISLCVYALLLFLLRAELFMEALKRVKTYLLSKRKIKN